MKLTILQNNIIKLLENYSTINENLLSTTTGSNIKLINSSDNEQYIVGFVSYIVPSIQNANDSVYDELVIEGVDQYGRNKKISISVSDIESNEFSGYNELFFTNELESQDANRIYSTQTTNVLTNKDIYKFGSDITNGMLIAYKKANGSEVRGIVTSIDEAKINLIRITDTNTLAPNTLTLIEATTDGFVGIVAEGIFESQSITLYWNDEDIWDDDEYWLDSLE